MKIPYFDSSLLRMRRNSIKQSAVVAHSTHPNEIIKIIGRGLLPRLLMYQAVATADIPLWVRWTLPCRHSRGGPLPVFNLEAINTLRSIHLCTMKPNNRDCCLVLVRAGSLNGTGYGREYVVRIAADQLNRTNHYHQDYGEHDRIFGDVLTFVVLPAELA